MHFAGNIFLYNLEGRESEEDLELPLFNLATISSATNNFSSYNKIGQGSFGPIYKVRKGDKEKVREGYFQWF